MCHHHRSRARWFSCRNSAQFRTSVLTFVDGFFLDRGFQIFITAYPEARKLLDYKALDLQRFYAGASVFYGGKFHTVADPLRHLWDSVASFTNPIGSDRLVARFAFTSQLKRTRYRYKIRFYFSTGQGPV